MRGPRSGEREGRGRRGGGRGGRTAPRDGPVARAEAAVRKRWCRGRMPSSRSVLLLLPVLLSRIQNTHGVASAASLTGTS